jgi:hypothetical protein
VQRPTTSTVERKAYLRHGAWQDAVLFSLIREDLDQ